MTTHNTREGIEELVDEFENRFSNMPNDNGIKHSQQVDFIRTTLHQELQKARHDWLREEIVKLEGMKKTMQTVTGHEQQYNFGNNQALQTIIDRYQSELDQPTDDKEEWVDPIN